MNKGKIKAFIIEDSKLYQAYMMKILSADEQIEVCGTVGTAEEAVKFIEKEKPDVITLDMALPDVTGFELLTCLVQKYEIPIIVVTSIPEMCEKAVELGAKDFIQKIQSGDKRSIEQFSLMLKLKIKMQATSFSGKKSPWRAEETRKTLLPKQQKYGTKNKMIALGASLGGTETTLEILKDLPEWMPGIVVVQHMPVGFTNAYAMRLDYSCKMRVKEAKNGDRVEPGSILVAKGGEQLTVYKTMEGYRVRTTQDNGSYNFCPSVDVLFKSVARAAGSAATGVILTGMGRDGAQGMLRMHENGAYNIGESEESCVVFGMPRAAAEAGGVDILLPKQEIAEHLIKRFAQ